MSETPASPRRGLALTGLVIAIALLIPGLWLPVITIRGVLEPAGIADIAPKLLDQGISQQTVDSLKPLINPAMLPFLEGTPGGLRAGIVSRLSGTLAAELKNGQPLEVYQQTRSILGSVKHLYEVGSNTAASLILLFSVLVPFIKALLVMWAVYRRDAERRLRTLRFVEIIAKWSMADVFAVAVIIAFLAAKATQTAAGSATALLTFTATFGPGFYWFAAYCLFSLFTQQVTTRLLMARR
ncbi:MAG TPA: paraquat-inducible protein A [Vicinamibacterales bacterium]|nr:paraquat-inducible protein A [Vicinamibacterales bacterium]